MAVIPISNWCEALCGRTTLCAGRGCSPTLCTRPRSAVTVAAAPAAAIGGAHTGAGTAFDAGVALVVVGDGNGVVIGESCCCFVAGSIIWVEKDVWGGSIFTLQV